MGHVLYHINSPKLIYFHYKKCGHPVGNVTNYVEGQGRPVVSAAVHTWPAVAAATEPGYI